MGYNGIQLKNSISIGKVYSIHYFEYMSTFSFKGESHDFWEFICVDKGDVSITAGLRTIDLKKGEIAFHEPQAIQRRIWWLFPSSATAAPCISSAKKF